MTNNELHLPCQDEFVRAAARLLLTERSTTSEHVAIMDQDSHWLSGLRFQKEDLR